MVDCHAIALAIAHHAELAASDAAVLRQDVPSRGCWPCPTELSRAAPRSRPAIRRASSVTKKYPHVEERHTGDQVVTDMTSAADISASDKIAPMFDHT